MDLAKLRSEITTDPAGLGYAPLVSSGNDAGLADRLNDRTKGGGIVQPIATPQALIWSAATGVRGKIEAGINDPTYGSACLAIRDGLTGGAATLDLTNPVISGPNGLLDALTKGGIFPPNTDTTGKAPTPGSKDHLLALATVPSSRAEALGLVAYGSTVTLADISQALRGHG